MSERETETETETETEKEREREREREREMGREKKGWEKAVGLCRRRWAV